MQRISALLTVKSKFQFCKFAAPLWQKEGMKVLVLDSWLNHLSLSSFLQKTVHKRVGPPLTTSCSSLLALQPELWSWSWSLWCCLSTATIDTRTKNWRWSSVKKRKMTQIFLKKKRLLFIAPSLITTVNLVNCYLNCLQTMTCFLKLHFQTLNPSNVLSFFFFFFSPREEINSFSRQASFRRLNSVSSDPRVQVQTHTNTHTHCWEQ